MPLDTRIPLMAQGIQLPDFNAIAAQKQEMARNAFVMQQAQQQAAERQQAMGLRKNIGGMAAAGDYAGARKAALKGGDFDMVEAVKGLSAEQKAAALERNQQMAKLAFSVGQLPYEQRHAAIRAAEPFISGLGIDAAQLEQFDPTDENISGIVNSVQSLDQLLKRQDEMNAPYTLDQGSRRYAGGKLIAENPAAPKYLTVPEGGTAYRIDGGNLSPASGAGNIPFDALLGIESGGNHFAKGGGPLLSPKGAVGIAQVMPGTAPEAARMAGLPWDEARYRGDPGYNRAIGEAYYNNLRQKYGDDIKAAAAYNAGPGAVDKALQQSGGNWLSMLPAETRNYVARLSPQNNMAPNVLQGRPKQAPQKDAPSGYRWTQNGDLQAVPGGPADPGSVELPAPKELAKRNAAYPKVTASYRASVQKIDQQIADLEALKTSPGLSSIVGAFDGRTPAILPASAAAKARLDKIMARGQFNELQDMRNNSPTGGALGQVSDSENKTLRQAAAALDRTQGEDDFKQAIDDYISALKFSKGNIQQTYDDTYSYRRGQRPQVSAPSSGGWGKAQVVR